MMPYKGQPCIGMRMAYKTNLSEQDHFLQSAAVIRPSLLLTAETSTLQPPASLMEEAGNDA